MSVEQAMTDGWVYTEERPHKTMALAMIELRGMKPHIFYDRGWRVGLFGCSVVIASSFKGACSIARLYS